MQLSTKQIIAALPALNPQDLYKVAVWCEALGASTVVPADDVFADHIFAELGKCLSEFYKYPTPPSFRVFLRGCRKQEKDAFLEGVEHIKQCAVSWWPSVSRNIRLGLVRYLCRVAFDACRRQHKRPGWRELSRLLCEIERVVEQEFPGWLSSGMFQDRALARISSHTVLRHAA